MLQEPAVKSAPYMPHGELHEWSKAAMVVFPLAFKATWQNGKQSPGMSGGSNPPVGPTNKE